MTMPVVLKQGLVPKHFRAWLRRYADAPVGVRRSPRLCPLACYFYSQGLKVSVTREAVLTQEGAYPLPQWARRFVQLTDQPSEERGNGNVLGREALSTLRAACRPGRRRRS